MFHINPPHILPVATKVLCWTFTFQYVDPAIMRHYRYLETYTIDLKGTRMPKNISFLKELNVYLYKKGKRTSFTVEEEV